MKHPYWFDVLWLTDTKRKYMSSLLVDIQSPSISWISRHVSWRLDEIESESLPVLFNPVPLIQYEACLCADDNWEQKVDINRTDWLSVSARVCTSLSTCMFGGCLWLWLHMSVQVCVSVCVTATPQTTGLLAQSRSVSEWLVKPATRIILL